MSLRRNLLRNKLLFKERRIWSKKMASMELPETDSSLIFKHKSEFTLEKSLLKLPKI